MPAIISNANYRPINNRVYRESGSDYLGPVTVVPTFATAKDQIRASAKISPSQFAGTRMAQMAALWERYRFTRYRLRYVPSVPTTLAAQLLMYQDTDPDDDPSVIEDKAALIRQAAAQAGSQEWNMSSPKAVELASRADHALYYTGAVQKDNPRLSLQGAAYIIQVSEAVNSNGEAIKGELTAGSVYVDWEIEYQTPQIDPSATLAALKHESQPLLVGVGASGASLPAGRYYVGVEYCPMSPNTLPVTGEGHVYGTPTGTTDKTALVTIKCSADPSEETIHIGTVGGTVDFPAGADLTLDDPENWFDEDIRLWFFPQYSS